MKLAASGQDEVEALGQWFDGAWLDELVLDGGVVTGTFEQSVRFDGVDREELPASTPAEETNWYRALKVPVVACRLAVRGATALHVPDLGAPVFDLSWRGAERELRFGTGVRIKCSHPNLEIEATDRVVGYQKVKFWRILGAQSSDPWDDG